MSQGLFPRVPTTLDLNGPVLSFTTNPVGVATTSGQTVTLTGMATVSFGSTADNTGAIAYRWYEDGVGALSDGTKFTGTGTTTLTISNATTPDDNNRKFYLQADYVPSVETGNASNEPLASGIATITVAPLIEIVAEPTDRQAVLNANATFTVDAGLTDTSYGSVSYQWTLNGEEVDDGVIQTTTTTSTTIPTPQEYNYTSDATVTLNNATDVEITVAGARGGSGGSDAGGPGGRGAQGRAGKFTYANGTRTLSLRVGRRGNDGGSGNFPAYGAGGSSTAADGGRGGGAGVSGWSGGGGGGGGASAVYDQTVGGYTIVSAGGGGGGGGSWNVGGDSGYNRNPGVGLGYGTGSVGNVQDGSQGGDKSGDGGGGGGGGGGAPGGNGGGAGQDNSSGGTAGSGGASAQNPSYVTRQGDGWLNDGDGYINLKYTALSERETTTTRNTTISGTKTPTLTIKSDVVGIQTVSCIISSVNATNNPGISTVVNFVTVSDAEQFNVNVENISSTSTAFLTSINLFNGDYEFETTQGDPENNAFSSLYSFYAPDRDIEVEMDLYAAKGYNSGSNLGGEGGFSRIRFTMTQNTEYVIAGLTTSINSPFVYRKGSLIACVGRGGNAGSGGKGGFGGGVGVGGQSGFGRGSGLGGTVVSAGNLPANGIFGSHTTLTATAPDTKATVPNGGIVLPCTRGVYWRNQGFSSCEDVGTSQFRLSDGTLVTNTASITRGYKAGYNIIQNSGAKIGNGGQGGTGATGGQGGDGGGGGGGSGYTDGSVTVIDTQLGGSAFANARVILRVVT